MKKFGEFSREELDNLLAMVGLDLRHPTVFGRDIWMYPMVLLSYVVLRLTRWYLRVSNYWER